MGFSGVAAAIDSTDLIWFRNTGELQFIQSTQAHHDGVFITKQSTCGNGGLFMVLRARWTLAGEPAEDRAEEDEDEESDEDDEDRVVLLLGPQTLILALPDAEDGDERDEEEGEALLPALPVRRDTQHSITSFMHLAEAFIQSALQCIQVIHFIFVSMCSLGIEPTTFCAANAMLYH